MDQQGNKNIPIPPIENPMETQPEGAVMPTEVPPVVAPDTTPRKFSPLVIGMGVLLMLFLLMTGFMAYQNSQLQGEMESLRAANVEMESKKMAPIEPVPTISADPMEDWETYKSDEVSFKYPQNLTLDVSGMDKYVALLSEPQDPTSSVFIIDYRLSGPLAEYSEAQSFWESRLENVEKSQIDNGIKMIGEGTEESTGEVFTVALIKYNGGAASMVTMKNDNESSMIFDQILSTFEFTE